MQKPRALLFFVAAVVWLTVPAIVFAQNPVVPQAPTGVEDYAFYDLCQLGQMAQNIINFLLGLSTFVATVMFAYAGVLYLTSTGNPIQVSRAHKIFKNVLIGFLVAITAWLVVQTFMSVVFRDSFFIGGNWNELECTGERLMNKDLGDLLGTVIPGLAPQITSVPTPSGAAYNVSCKSGSVYDPERRLCFNLEAGTYTQPIAITVGGATRSAADLSAAVQATETYAAQLRTICAQQGYNDCATAQAIMAIESAGRPAVCSGAGACGLMQIMPDTARGLDSSLAGLSNAQIQQKLKDPTYNMNLGVKYLAQMDQQFDGPNLIASYNGGPRANNPSKTCVGQTWWSCNQNIGYAETRAYVPNVQAARNLITQ